MIGLGIVGTDHLAMRMIKCVAQVEGVRVTAIASTRQGPAAPLAEPLGATVCADAVELASRPEVDAVYVNNNNPYHAEAVRAAIAAGKPVLVQKPIALTLSETEEIVAQARDAGVLLVENLWCLTVPAAQTLIAQADAAALGRPLAFSLDFGIPVKPDLYPALFSPELGVLRDRAGYGIALARRILGPIADLSAQVNWQGDVDTSAMILMRHRSGAMSKLGFSFDALMSNKATLACSGGLYRLEPSLGGTSLMSQVAEAQIGPLTKPPRRRISSLTMGKALRRFGKTPKAAKYPLGSDLHLPMLRHFVDLIRVGKKESPLVPLDLSVETQRLVEQARTRVGLAA